MTRAAQVLFAVVMSAAVIGFVVGIDDGVPRRVEPPPPRPLEVVDNAAPDAAGAMPATPYGELHRTRLGANATYRHHLEDVAAPPPPPETAPDLKAKRASLADRSARRAYNGAPPVIPHAVDAISSDACLGCHAVGVVVGEDRADRMPHPYLSACQQCHVPAEAPLASTLEVASDFVGLPAPIEGRRAWRGAPPTIPHSTLMREACDSCHGVGGKPGLRTSHPERASCTQCHAPSAALDQLAVGPASFVDGPDLTSAARR